MHHGGYLQRQFKVWHIQGFFKWNEEESIHEESAPFATYFLSTKVPGCFLSQSEAPQLSPESLNGAVYWGFPKA